MNITIWLYDHTLLDSQAYIKRMTELPHSIRNEVGRYRSPSDKAERIAGKLLLQKAILATGRSPDLLNAWQRDLYNKPFIKDWHSFNISHSHRYVSLAFGGSSPLGIDLQHMEPLADLQSLITNFTLQEQDYISAADTPIAFFHVWSRKEAVLKAIGRGIVGGLKEFSCLDDVIDFEGKRWAVEGIPAPPNYIGHLARAAEDLHTEISVEEIRTPL
ncbi:MAG: 4'-phosphopantetheinyl transferase superfamily protein [Bacteroidetes bacterium]|nr:4'-phosphopantetheinyl transferase superfamily protein [Bacteroidota bacterium]